MEAEAPELEVGGRELRVDRRDFLTSETGSADVLVRKRVRSARKS